MDYEYRGRESHQAFQEREDYMNQDKEEAPIPALKRLLSESRRLRVVSLSNPSYLVPTNYPDLFTSEDEEATN